MWEGGKRETGKVEGRVTGLVCKMKRNLNKNLLSKCKYSCISLDCGYL